MAPKVKLKPPFMGQHLTLSGWFRDGFSRIFSNFMILLFSKSLSSLFSGTRLVTLVMQWPGTRRRLVGKRATADIWRQNFSSCIFSSNAKELELISWSCRMGGVSGPQLAKADVFSLGLSVYEAARLRRFFQALSSLHFAFLANDFTQQTIISHSQYLRTGCPRTLTREQTSPPFARVSSPQCLNFPRFELFYQKTANVVNTRRFFHTSSILPRTWCCSCALLPRLSLATDPQQTGRCGFCLLIFHIVLTIKL